MSVLKKIIVCLLANLLIATVLLAKGPIRIGDVNSFTGIAAPFTGPYKKGVELAIREVNQNHGVNGRPIEVIFRDDKGLPQEALREAEELVNQEEVDLIAGTFLSNVALAVSAWAKENKIMFVAAEPLTESLTWSQGHDYIVRVRPNTYEQGRMLAERASKTSYTRWATIGPDYEYGHRAWETFRDRLHELKPQTEVVGELWSPLGKLDAATYVPAVLQKHPQALYVSLFGTDWLAFVREARKYDLFSKIYVVGILLGEPEYLQPLKDEAPVGMLVTGYPRDQIVSTAHRAFITAYRAAYHEDPMLGSLVGYMTYQSIFAAIRKASRVDSASLSRAFKNLRVVTPLGPITFREIDGQSTMGAWVGTLAYDKGLRKVTMTNVEYVGGDTVLPPAAYVTQQRNQHAH